MIVTNAANNILGQSITIEDRSFEVVTKFIYLGSILTKDNRIEEKIRRRIILVNRVYFDLREQFRFKYLLIQSKVTLYKTLIRPILTYGAKAWTITKMSEACLGFFERRILRRILGPVQKDGLRGQRYNFELYDHNQVESTLITRFIKIQRLRWLGHIERMEENRAAKKVIFRSMEGRKKREKSRLRWLDDVKADLHCLKVRN